MTIRCLVGSLVLLSGVLGAAACVAEGDSGTPRNPVTPAPPKPPYAADMEACMPEIYAYTSVVDLARRMGRDSDVFDDAIGDLRDQLIDCLTYQPADLIPISRRGRPL